MPIPVPAEWWAVLNLSSKFGQTCQVVQSRTKPKGGPGISIQGPFPSRQEAQNVCNTIGKGGPPPLPNPLAFLGWIQEIGHYVGLAVAYITDGPMWRSIGWIVLGFIFLVSGVILWAMKAAGVGSVAELGAALAG